MTDRSKTTGPRPVRTGKFQYAGEIFFGRVTTVNDVAQTVGVKLSDYEGAMNDDSDEMTARVYIIGNQSAKLSQCAPRLQARDLEADPIKYGTLVRLHYDSEGNLWVRDPVFCTYDVANDKHGSIDWDDDNQRLYARGTAVEP